MSKRRYTVQRTSKRRGQSLSGSFIPFGIGGLVLAAIAGYMFIQPPPTDPKTFCPQNPASTGITAFLIDVSDTLSDSQVARLQTELKNISNVSEKRPSAFLKKGEKLLIYFVQPTGQKPSLVFSMCHPGDIANKTVTDKLSEGAIFARKKWQKFTDDMMLNIDSKVNSSKEMSTSPIVESIQFIRANDFPPPDLMSEGVKHRLVIWSDFLQNSAEGNHFKNLDEGEAFYARNPVDLDLVELTTFYMLSKKYSKHQTKEHKKFWRTFFNKTKADFLLWDTIK